MQPSSVPAISGNRCIFSKDQSNGAVPGRLSIEQYNDAGTIEVARVRGQTRPQRPIGRGSTGVAALAVDTAYRVTFTVHPSDGSRLYLDGNEVANASGGEVWGQVTFPFTIGAHLASDGTSQRASFTASSTKWSSGPTSSRRPRLRACRPRSRSPAAAAARALRHQRQLRAVHGRHDAGPRRPGNDSNLTSRTITKLSAPERRHRLDHQQFGRLGGHCAMCCRARAARRRTRSPTAWMAPTPRP